MNRLQVIEFMLEVATQQDAFSLLEEKLSNLTKVELMMSLLHCGTIPEQFKPDSSAEKLWAKYCDILLSRSFNFLDIASEVLRTRGNSADVFGRTSSYTIVADAKAFRLSRTAKNQKDFKVSALNDWRRDDTYACLVAPLLHYPQQRSQIYAQAIQHRVILLGYEHIWLLLEFTPSRISELLESVWGIFDETTENSQSAELYWSMIDNSLLDVTGQSKTTLNVIKQNFAAELVKLGQEGITYWRTIMDTYWRMSREQAISRLIDAEKIPQKVSTIHTLLRRIAMLYEDLD